MELALPTTCELVEVGVVTLITMPLHENYLMVTLLTGTKFSVYKHLAAVLSMTIGRGSDRRDYYVTQLTFDPFVLNFGED